MSKVIVITGAGSGLGRALAERLGREGETVVLLARSLDKIEAVARKIGDSAMAVACDVRSPDSVREAFAKIAARYPTIDILINNAGIFTPSAVEEASDEHIASVIGTNLLGPIYCSRAAIPMIPPGGRIINVSSESIQSRMPLLIMYRSSKAGLEEFSAALQTELLPKRINVTVIRAGTMIGEDSMLKEFDPVMAAKSAAAWADAGLDMRSMAFSSFEAATHPFRAVIDLPADLHMPVILLCAAKTDSGPSFAELAGDHAG